MLGGYSEQRENIYSATYDLKYVNKYSKKFGKFNGLGGLFLLAIIVETYIHNY